MKTIRNFPVYIAAAMSMGLIGCEEKSEPVAVTLVSKDYQREAVIRDSMNTVFDKKLHEINADLTLVNDKRGVKSLGYGTPLEDNISMKERIRRNIEVISTLVDDNKKKIAFLSSEVKKYKKENSSITEALKQDIKRFQAYE